MLLAKSPLPLKTGKDSCLKESEYTMSDSNPATANAFWTGRRDPIQENVAGKPGPSTKTSVSAGACRRNLTVLLLALLDRLCELFLGDVFIGHLDLGHQVIDDLFLE
jgi:hypothetical protein